MTATTNTMKLTTPGDLAIVIAREFNAPLQLVWDAHTKPEIVQRWLLGPDGWTMPLCEIDLRVGGSYRYVWRHGDGREMGTGGRFLEITPRSRIVATERFDEPWFPGEALNTTEFADVGGRTLHTLTIRHESKEARDKALKSGMDEGLAFCYDRLETVLTS